MIPLLHLSEENSTVVKYIIGELVRNVLEHAFAEDGAIVAAQYYKKTNRVYKNANDDTREIISIVYRYMQESLAEDN